MASYVFASFDFVASLSVCCAVSQKILCQGFGSAATLREYPLPVAIKVQICC